MDRTRRGSGKELGGGADYAMVDGGARLMKKGMVIIPKTFGVVVPEWRQATIKAANP